MRKLLLTAVVAALGHAFAATITEATALLDRGDTKGAVSAALEINTPEALALAAKATTLGAELAPDAQRPGMFDKAVSYARKAVAMNPNLAVGHFELARALGRLAQYRGVLQSLGIAGEMKTELTRAISLDPNMAGAYVALGLWNAEVPFFAGGNKGQVQPNFETAIRLEPESVTHRLEYANALLKINRRNVPAAIQVLEGAVKLPPRNFWEARDLEEAKRLLGTLRP